MAAYASEIMNGEKELPSGPEETDPEWVLPDELDHESVLLARDRSESKYDCYQVVLEGTDSPIMYRAQWKDDWEILGATIEEHDGHERLRLTLIERVEEQPYRAYTLALVGSGLTVMYVDVGEWLVTTNQLPEWGWLFGQFVALVSLSVCFGYGLKAVVKHLRGSSGVTRP